MIFTSTLLFSPIPKKNTEIQQIEESDTPTSLRHRENIGRIGSLSVFWQMSVIAVFPLKTGDSMFVGFDSQNTFTYFSWASLACFFPERSGQANHHRADSRNGKDHRGSSSQPEARPPFPLTWPHISDERLD